LELLLPLISIKSIGAGGLSPHSHPLALMLDPPLTGGMCPLLGTVTQSARSYLLKSVTQC
jgi:hypothetical protein